MAAVVVTTVDLAVAAVVGVGVVVAVVDARRERFFSGSAFGALSAAAGSGAETATGVTSTGARTLVSAENVLSIA
jgi:hypothetical protein